MTPDGQITFFGKEKKKEKREENREIKAEKEIDQYIKDALDKGIYCDLELI